MFLKITEENFNIYCILSMTISSFLKSLFFPFNNTFIKDKY